MSHTKRHENSPAILAFAADHDLIRQDLISNPERFTRRHDLNAFDPEELGEDWGEVYLLVSGFEETRVWQNKKIKALLYLAHKNEIPVKLTLTAETDETLERTLEGYRQARESDAEEIAASFLGGDGECWTTRSGVDLIDFLEATSNSKESNEDRSVVRYVFGVGAIVVTDSWWDVEGSTPFVSQYEEGEGSSAL